MKPSVATEHTLDGEHPRLIRTKRAAGFLSKLFSSSRKAESLLPEVDESKKSAQAAADNLFSILAKYISPELKRLDVYDDEEKDGRIVHFGFSREKAENRSVHDPKDDGIWEFELGNRKRLGATRIFLNPDLSNVGVRDPKYPTFHRLNEYSAREQIEFYRTIEQAFGTLVLAQHTGNMRFNLEALPLSA